jgi:hypothetical protein
MLNRKTRGGAMRIIILCLSFLPLFSSFVHTEETPLPLAVGNKWVYLHEHWVTWDETVTATDTLTIAVTDTIQKDGKTYFIFSMDPVFFPDTTQVYYRVEGKTALKYHQENNEQLAIDLSSCGEGVGECYTTGPHTVYQYGIPGWYRCERYELSSMQLPIGLVEGHSISVVYMADFGNLFSRFLAPGLGVAYLSESYNVDTPEGANGDRYSLIRATIDGHDVVAGVQIANETPAPFTLFQNNPNPFNPVTTISYSLLTYSSVTIAVFNAIGQQVQTRDLSIQTPGMHEFVFDGTGMPSGMYFYRVTAGEKEKVGKMVMMR